MPVSRSAEKKVRKDKFRTKLNKKRLAGFKQLLKKVKTKATVENLRLVQSTIDKLVKVKAIHKNKGARLKSRLSKLVKKKP